LEISAHCAGNCWWWQWSVRWCRLFPENLTGCIASARDYLAQGDTARRSSS
jgi:hypothetical protein